MNTQTEITITYQVSIALTYESETEREHIVVTELDSGARYRKWNDGVWQRLDSSKQTQVTEGWLIDRLERCAAEHQSHIDKAQRRLRPGRNGQPRPPIWKDDPHTHTKHGRDRREAGV